MNRILLVFCVFLLGSAFASSNLAHAAEGVQNQKPVAAPSPKVTLPKSPMILAAAEVGKIKMNASSSGLRGWDYLYHRLSENGLDSVFVSMLLSDRRMPERETLYFSLNPKEPKSLYRKVNTSRNRQSAITFYQKNKSYFQLAKTKYGIPPSVIAAIIQVESSSGTFTGRSPVFFRLARLANAAEPQNVKANFERQRSANKNVKLTDVSARAQWLEDTFLPHTAATVVLAQILGVHPLELKGSSAGAIGLPQFLPGNYFRFGIDGNHSGDINLEHPADAILSLANYLAESGWNKPKLTPQEQRMVIWHYNHSDAYIEAVLGLAKALDKSLV